MEKVIVLGVKNTNEFFGGCFKYTNDDKLVEDVSKKHPKSDFIVVYAENFSDLEEWLEEATK